MRGAERLENTKGKVRVRVMHGCCAGAETMEYRRDQDSWNSLMSIACTAWIYLLGFLIQNSKFPQAGGAGAVSVLCLVRRGFQFYPLHGG